MINMFTKRLIIWKEGVSPPRQLIWPDEFGTNKIIYGVNSNGLINKF